MRPHYPCVKRFPPSVSPVVSFVTWQIHHWRLENQLEYWNLNRLFSDSNILDTTPRQIRVYSPI